MVEDLGPEVERCGDDESRDNKRQQRRQPQERQAEQAGQCDLVQDAEEDEAVRRGKPCGGRYRERRPGDHGETFPEAVPADLFAVSEEQADADQEQEGRGDAARVEFPPAEGGQARVGVAEEFEIPGEVVARHGN